MLSSFRTYQITFQAFHSDMHWYQVVSIVSNKPLFQLYCTFPILLFSWRIFLIVFTFSCMLLLCVVETNALIYTATSKANSYCQYWSRAYNACGIVSNKNNKSESKREKKRLKITLHPTWESRHLSFLFAVLSKGNEKEPNQRIGGARKLKPWSYFYTTSSVWLQLFLTGASCFLQFYTLCTHTKRQSFQAQSRRLYNN